MSRSLYDLLLDTGGLFKGNWRVFATANRWETGEAKVK